MANLLDVYMYSHPAIDLLANMETREIKPDGQARLIFVDVAALSLIDDDVNGVADSQPNSEVIYRPNFIRELCRIINVSVSISMLW